MKITKLFLSLALLTEVAGAQAKPGVTSTLNQAFAPYVVGSIQTAPGSSNENYMAGVGLESSSNHILLDVNGVYETANVTAGAGHTGTIQASGYYKLFGRLLVGAGANLIINTNGFATSHYMNPTRESGNPFISAGLQIWDVRSIVSYQLTADDGIQEQIKFNWNSELALTRHIRFTVPVVINSYQSGPLRSLGGRRVLVTQVGAGVKLVF
jgi:hypothetical protein